MLYDKSSVLETVIETKFYYSTRTIWYYVKLNLTTIRHNRWTLLKKAYQQVLKEDGKFSFNSCFSFVLDESRTTIKNSKRQKLNYYDYLSIYNLILYD